VVGRLCREWLVDLEAIPVGVEDEGLPARADGHRSPNGEPGCSEFGDGGIEVFDEECDMLADVVGHGAGDQVDLSSRPDVEPGARYGDALAGQDGEAEHVGVEGDRTVEIRDVDGDVVKIDDAHVVTVAGALLLAGGADELCGAERE
jgi:hypothetical protein